MGGIRIAERCEQWSLRKCDVKTRWSRRLKVGEAMECDFSYLIDDPALPAPSSRLSRKETRIICLHYIIQIGSVSLHCKSNQYPLAACKLPVML